MLTLYSTGLPIVANWIPYMSIFRWGFEALTINEYQGLTFSCGGSTTGCLTTGEQVLQTLSFGGHTTSYPVFGLGMVLLAFLLGGYLMLYMVRLQFISLGHEGSFFAKHNTLTSAQKVSPQQQQQLQLHGGPREVELVPSGNVGSNHGYQVVQSNENDNLEDP